MGSGTNLYWMEKETWKVKEQLVKIKSSGTLIFNNKIILITYDKNLISP